MWKEEEEWESEKKEKPIMFYCGPKRAIERDAMWSAEIGSRDVIAIGQWHHPVCMCVWCRCNTHRPASLSLSLSLLASVSLLYLQIVATHKIWGFPRCFTWHCAQPEHTARTNGMPAAGRLEKRSRGKKRKKERRGIIWQHLGGCAQRALRKRDNKERKIGRRRETENKIQWADTLFLR